MAARLEYAATQKDRIKACDEAVQDAIDWHARVQAMKEAGRATPVDELKAQAWLLKTQIARENAETDE